MTAVDRTYRLRRYGFGHRNRKRVYVISNGSGPGADFEVWRGLDHLRSLPTFDEAIRWAQARAVLDRYPDAPRYRLDSPRKQGQEPRTGPPGGPNHTHVIPGPQNGSNDLDTFPAPMEAP